MADFYTQMAGVTRSLLAPTSAGGLGQGQVEITRRVEGQYDPSNPTAPVTPTYTTQPIRAAVRGVSQQMIGTDYGGGVLIGSDRVVIAEVPSIPYGANDTMTIDGVAVNILRVENIPSAGTAAAVRFYVRGGV